MSDFDPIIPRPADSDDHASATPTEPSTAQDMPLESPRQEDNAATSIESVSGESIAEVPVAESATGETANPPTATETPAVSEATPPPPIRPTVTSTLPPHAPGQQPAPGYRPTPGYYPPQPGYPPNPSAQNYPPQRTMQGYPPPSGYRPQNPTGNYPPPRPTTLPFVPPDEPKKSRAASTPEARLSRGSKIYAIVMSVIAGILAILLIGVVLSMASTNFSYIQRPGITTPADDSEAVVGVEQAKNSVVMLEVRTVAGTSLGTGVVISEDGYIATNHHVIENAISIRVTFYDGYVIAAEVIGSSENDDLAVIKVNRRGLVPAVFGYSDQCYVGETVYAIGTPAATSYGWTTTKGIISYKDREVKVYDETTGEILRRLRLLQTDANVNPGNSGGPLINTRGEVVGIVSMKLAFGYEGVGFAIPSDGAVEILEAIIKDGNADGVDSSISFDFVRPLIGITGVYMKEGNYYVLEGDRITQLDPGEIDKYPAEKVVHPVASGIYVTALTDGMDAVGKLQVGDIITAVQAKDVTSMATLVNEINNYFAGDTVTVSVNRNGEQLQLQITLAAEKTN